jgi:hypothetical protein
LIDHITSTIQLELEGPSPPTAVSNSSYLLAFIIPSCVFHYQVTYYTWLPAQLAEVGLNRVDGLPVAVELCFACSLLAENSCVFLGKTVLQLFRVASRKSSLQILRVCSMDRG